MPRVNVTGQWLRNKIAEMERVVRQYLDSDAYEEYFDRIAGKVDTQNAAISTARDQIQNALSVVASLEDDLDDKS